MCTRVSVHGFEKRIFNTDKHDISRKLLRAFEYYGYKLKFQQEFGKTERKPKSRELGSG